MCHNCVTLKVNTIWCIFIRIYAVLAHFSFAFVSLPLCPSLSLSLHSSAVIISLIAALFTRNNVLVIRTWALFWHPKYLSIILSAFVLCSEMLSFFSLSIRVLLCAHLFLPFCFMPMDVFQKLAMLHKRDSRSSKDLFEKSGGRYYKRDSLSYFPCTQLIRGCHQEKRQIYKKTAPPSEWEIVPSKRAVKKKNQRFSYGVCVSVCFCVEEFSRAVQSTQQ